MLLKALHETRLMKAPQVIMLRLLTADLSGASPARIAWSTGLPKTTVSMAINQMEAAGLVERQFQARDQRRQLIYLTERGRADTERMLAAMTAYVAEVKKREGRVNPAVDPAMGSW